MLFAESALAVLLTGTRVALIGIGQSVAIAVGIESPGVASGVRDAAAIHVVLFTCSTPAPLRGARRRRVGCWIAAADGWESC